MMKKVLASGIALGLLVSMAPGVASAQTSTTTTTTTTELAALLEQIKKLQDQLAELTKQRGALVTDLKSTWALAADLREGMSGDEVKALQEILAADPEIYPEGLVSGYYGPLTAKAVRKFQMKHGIDAVGSVGPKTRARLNALVGDETFACRAWGKLIAPGQMKKRLGSADVDLSHCAKVPGGIMKKLNGDWRNGTSTTSTSTDTTAPGISNIEFEEGTTTATIEWETNEKTKSVVWYSTESGVDLDDSDTEKETSSTFELEHELMLEDLEEDTDYFFFIVATDKAGNSATSSTQNFQTD